jgi:hypothetical protein
MALTSGSIAFTGFNADSTDDLAFAALEAIAAGTVINFTDNAWTGSGFGTGESVWTWTASGEVAAGSIVTINDLASGAATSNLGTVAFTDATAPGLDDADEIVYAYTGDPAAPSAFLSAIANDTFTVNGATLSGTGLTAGIDAIALSAKDADADIAQYDTQRSGLGGLVDYRALISSASNWRTQDAFGDQSNDTSSPNLPFSQVPLSAAPALGTGAIAFTGFSAEGQGDLEHRV